MDDPRGAEDARGKPVAAGRPWFSVGLRRLAPVLVVTAAIGIACTLATPDGSGKAGGSAGAAGDGKDPAYYEGFVRRFRKAQELFGSGKDDQAEKMFRELLEEEPEAAAIHHALAYIAWFRGERNQALDGFRRAAKLAPEDGAIRRDCGLRLVETGHLDEALPHLEAARRLLEPDVETICAHGRCLEARGSLPEAERAYRDAHTLEPDSVDARSLLARRVLEARPEESLKLLDGVPRNWPDVVTTAALALERLGRWDEACAMHRRLVEIGGEQPAVALLRDGAEGLVRCGDSAGAVKLAARWVAADRNDDVPGLRASVCLAVALAGTGDAAGALKALDASPVPEATPPAVRAHLALLRTHCLVLADRPEEARKLLETVAGTDAAFERVAAAFLLGSSDDAALAEAAAASPGRANDADWIRGLSARLAGDAAKAAELFRKAADASQPPGEHPGGLVRSFAAGR